MIFARYYFFCYQREYGCELQIHLQGRLMLEATIYVSFVFVLQLVFSVCAYVHINCFRLQLLMEM